MGLFTMVPNEHVNLSVVADEHALTVANVHDTAQLSMTQVAFVNKPSIDIADMLKTSAPTDDVEMTDAIGLPAASGLRSGAPGIFSYLEQLAEVAATRSAEDEKSQLKDAGESTMTTDVSLDSDGIVQYAINPKILIKRTATSLRDNSRTQESLKRRCLTQTSPLTTVTASSEAHTFVPRKDLVGQPPELRDAIYTQTVFERDPISLDRVCMPEICRTNKQVLGEAMPIYFAVNRFKGCLHMPHTFEAALNPADNHKTFKPATICPSNILRVSKPCFGDFAIKDVKFDIIDVDHAHFASLEISISKRGAGSVKITCTEGPEMVAESEKSMCSDMKYVSPRGGSEYRLC